MMDFISAGSIDGISIFLVMATLEGKQQIAEARLTPILFKQDWTTLANSSGGRSLTSLLTILTNRGALGAPWIWAILTVVSVKTKLIKSFSKPNIHYSSRQYSILSSLILKTHRITFFS